MKSALNIEFATLHGYRPLRLDLHVPADAGRPVPVVLWLHGGGYALGSKSGGPALELVELGCAVASVEYRRSAEARLPAAVHDVKGAVRWLRGHADEYHLDPDRVGVWGSSAGGQLAALLATTAGVAELEGDVGDNLECSSRVQTAVNWSGLTDLLLASDASERSRDFVTLAFGRSAREAPELVRLLDPATHARADAAPTLIVHSKGDANVPFDSADRLAAALRRADAEVILHGLDGDVHGGGFNTDRDVIELSKRFLIGHLVGAPATAPA
jgi:acetyl esterase/lipase